MIMTMTELSKVRKNIIASQNYWKMAETRGFSMKHKK